MARIPKEMEKYFKDPKLDTFTSTSELNAEIRKRLNLGSDNKRIGFVQVEGRRVPLAFALTPENSAIAFNDFSWRGLKQEDKIRVTYNFIQEIMKTKYPKLKAPNLNMIAMSGHEDIHCRALYSPESYWDRSFVYLPTDTLKKADGILMADSIGHELQHHHDYEYVAKDVLPEFIANYVSSEDAAAGRIKDVIMRLPLDGTVYNHSSKKEDEITPELREKIMMVKSRYASIRINEHRSGISSCKSMKDVIGTVRYLAYRFSALENRAFEAGIETAQSIVDKNKGMGIVSQIDEMTLNVLKADRMICHQSAEMLEKLTGLTMYKISDLFTRRSYLTSLSNSPENEQSIAYIDLQIDGICNLVYDNIVEPQNEQALND